VDHQDPGPARVTRDFDFLVAESARGDREVVGVLYEHGFELASRVDEREEIVRTIDDAAVASARLRLDQPKSAYFLSRALGLRVDLLFDFPIPAARAAANAARKRIQGYSFRIARRADLIEMKEIAAADRGRSSDLQDLEFLKRKG
jgi:hypothetical protein